jgi:hypothetical protein
MSDAQGAVTHVFPDRGAGEWVALEDYIAVVRRAERAEVERNDSSWARSRAVGIAERAVDERDALQAENERLRAKMMDAGVSPNKPSMKELIRDVAAGLSRI